MNNFMRGFLGAYIGAAVAQSYFDKKMAKEFEKLKEEKTAGQKIDEAVRLGILTEEEAKELRE